MSRISRFVTRVAGPADVGSVARLFRLVRRTCLPYLPDLHSPDEGLGFFRDHVFPGCTVWVALGNGIEGFCAWRPGRVDHLYVHPDHHGRGIGTALLSHAMDGQPLLRLLVFRRNVRAARFYASRGFRVVEHTDGGGNEEREPDTLVEWVHVG